jgi:hypothetical protein
VIYVDGCHLKVRDRELNARLEWNILHDRPAIILQLGKARIDCPVENIALKNLNNLFGCMYSNRAFKKTKQVVYENGQARYVIHVRMRDDDVAHGAVLLIRERHGDASGVNGYHVVN